MKGSYYTLEAGIAAFMVISIFALLFLITPTNPEVQRANIKNDVYKGLDVLNSQGSLKTNALNNNATAIKTDLAKFISITLSNDVTIYNRTFVNVSSSFSARSTDTIVVSYFIAGNDGNYTPREIRAYVWGFQ